jgi:hypothetical protein
MKVSKLILSVAALAAITTATAFAADDATTTVGGVYVPTEIAGINVQPEPDRPYLATASNDLATKLYEPQKVTQALNNVIAAENALNLALKELNHVMDNTDNGSEFKHLGGLVAIMTKNAAESKTFLDYAQEKDPIAMKELTVQLEKLRSGDLSANVARIEKILEIGGFQVFPDQIIKSNGGFATMNLGGFDMRCTTEGYMNSTPVDENYVVCTSAEPGTIKTATGQKTVSDFAVGVYHKTDRTVSMIKWPTKFSNIDYPMDWFNINSTNPKTKVYWQGIKYGGDQMNPKVHSQGETVTFQDVVKAP